MGRLIPVPSSLNHRVNILNLKNIFICLVFVNLASQLQFKGPLTGYVGTW